MSDLYKPKPKKDSADVVRVNLKVLLGLLTLAGMLVTAGGSIYVALHRIGAVEARVAEQAAELEDLAGQLRAPRYTLDDDERRTSDLRREWAVFYDNIRDELDDRKEWMDGMNAFVRETTAFVAETRASTREIHNLLSRIETRLGE